MTIQIIKDIHHYYFNKKLNKGYWLTTQIHDEKRSIQNIAEEIGCSEKCINKKISVRQKKGEIGRDVLNGVHTCKFHILTKSRLVFVFKIFKKKIIGPIDELYPQLKSRNAKIFAKILFEMEQKDLDTGNSAGIKAGYNRKDFYIMVGKFILVLYEFDSFYSERIDYFLKRILDHNDIFYLDELSNPDNWYPNRSLFLTQKYYAMRNYSDDQIILLTTMDYENIDNITYLPVIKNNRVVSPVKRLF